MPFRHWTWRPPTSIKGPSTVAGWRRQSPVALGLPSPRFQTRSISGLNWNNEKVAKTWDFCRNCVVSIRSVVAALPYTPHPLVLLLHRVPLPQPTHLPGLPRPTSLFTPQDGGSEADSHVTYYPASLCPLPLASPPYDGYFNLQTAFSPLPHPSCLTDTTSHTGQLCPTIPS